MDQVKLWIGKQLYQHEEKIRVKSDELLYDGKVDEAVELKTRGLGPEVFTECAGWAEAVMVHSSLDSESDLYQAWWKYYYYTKFYGLIVKNWLLRPLSRS